MAAVSAARYTRDVKLCPNPRCPYRARRGAPAEYLDRAQVCSDCAIPLVDAAAFDTAESKRAVAEWHEAREASSPSGTAEATNPRVDVITGLGVLGLCLVLVVASCGVTTSLGQSGYIIAVGPFVYGVVRLLRGLGVPSRGRRSEPHGDGPYRS